MLNIFFFFYVEHLFMCVFAVQICLLGIFVHLLSFMMFV